MKRVQKHIVRNTRPSGLFGHQSAHKNRHQGEVLSLADRLGFSTEGKAQAYCGEYVKK